MQKKYIKAEINGKTRKLRLISARYAKTGNLALKAFDAFSGELFENVTIAVPDPIPPNFAYIDVKSFPDAPSILEEHRIAKMAGSSVVIDGYTYPLVIFDSSVLSEYLA